METPHASRGTGVHQQQQQHDAWSSSPSKFDPFGHHQRDQQQQSIPSALPAPSIPFKFLQGGRGEALRRNASFTSTSSTTSSSSNSGSSSRRSGSTSRTAASAIEEELALPIAAGRAGVGAGVGPGTMPSAAPAAGGIRKPAERIQIVRQTSLFADENDPVHHPISSPSSHQQRGALESSMMASRAQGQGQGVNQSAGAAVGGKAATGANAGVSYAAAAAAAAAARGGSSGAAAPSPTSSKRDSASTTSPTTTTTTPTTAYSASPIARPSSGEYAMSRSLSRERGEGAERSVKPAAANANGGTSHVQPAAGAGQGTGAGPGAGTWSGGYRQTLSQRSHSHHGAAYAPSTGGTTSGSNASGESMTASLSRGLETMHENETSNASGSATFPPLSGSAATMSSGIHEHYPPPAASSSSSAAAPRHRSASSAAALEQQGRKAWDSHPSFYGDPSGGGGAGPGYFSNQYGGNPQPSSHAMPPPHTAYQRSNSAAVLEAQHRYAARPTSVAAAQHHHHHHDPGLDSYGGRAFSPQQLSASSGSASAAAFGSKVEYYDGDTPYAGRSLSRADSSSAAIPSNSSPFYSHFGTFAVPAGGGGGMGGEDGTESRRHSIAVSSPPVQTSIAEPRRAVGFNVSGPATTSSGRAAAPGGAASQQHAGSVFGGGSSALSMDDLASDLGSFTVSERVPSSHAAMQGAHAASMPGFTSTQSSLYGHNSPTHSATGRTSFGGAMWDALGREGEGREGPGVRSRFRAASMGPGAGVDYNDTMSGQETPLARTSQHSPTSASGRKGGDSATTISEQYSSSPIGSGNVPWADASAASYSSSSSSAHMENAARAAFGKGNRQRAGSNISYDSSGAYGPSAPFGAANNGGGASSDAMLASLGFPQLSDMTFHSLATLGPLAPPQPGGEHGPASLQELGKGIPLHALPGDMSLYIVEFKQGRTDLYFKQQWGTPEDFEVCKGDLVVVEADRGKDLGTVVNDSISVAQVQSFLAHQNGMRAAGHPDAHSKIRVICPKRLYGRATPADTALLFSKAQDEDRALQLCVTKVTQRGLPMSVIAAEMQWDRRKLTFYYTANVRVDFRDLVKELFRLYKTRIWMCNIGHPGGP